MTFTLGDLLTILIVLVVLLVYRQLDKNNRSLEKVKRFSDKVRDDLDKIVQEKAAQLKDIGIEIEVHQKTAREVFKRIKEIEDGLNARASDMEQIGVRIGEYDKVLDELVQMTARVEENIGRLKEESAFVDGLGKRIRAAGGSIEQLERSIPVLVEDFGRRNGEELARLTERTVAEIDGRMETFRGELESARSYVDELTAFVRGISEKADAVASETETRLSSHADEVLSTVSREKTEALEELGERLLAFHETVERTESEYTERLESVRRKGEALETEALRRLSEKIDAEFSGLETRADTGLSALEERIGSRLSELESRTGTRLSEHETRTDARLSELEASAGAMFTELRDSTEAKLTELEDATDARLSEFEARTGAKITGLEESTDSRFTKLEESAGSRFSRLETETGARFADLQDSTDARFAELEEATGSRFTELRDSTGARLAELEEAAGSRIAEVRDSTDARLTELEAASGARLAEIRERIYARISEIESRLSGHIEMIENRLAESGSGFEERLETLEAQSASRLTELERRLEAAYESVTRKGEESMRVTLGTLDTSLERSRAELTGKMEDFRIRIDSWQHELGTLVDALDAKFKETAGNADALDENVRIRLQTLSTEMDSLAAEINSRLSQTIAEASGLAENMALRFSREQEERGRLFTEQLEARHAELAAEVERAEKEWSAQLSEAREQLQRWKKANESVLESYREEFAEEMRAFKTGIDGRLNESNAELGRLAEISSEIDRTIGQLELRISNEREKFETTLAASGTELAERLELESSKVESSVLRKLEANLLEYETGISYRLERVDAVGKEIEGLESRLREAAAAVSAKLHAEFESFENELAEQRAMRIRKSDEEYASVRTAMKELEAGLAELKTKAYENVSMKLQGFEEEFFSDLTARGAAMDQRLATWQKDVNARIEGITEEQLKARESVEKAYKAELKQKLTELHGRVHQLIEKFEEQVRKYQEGMQTKLVVSEKSLAAFQDNIKTEMDALRQTLLESFRTDLGTVNLRITEQLRKSEKDLETRLKELHEQVESENREIAMLMDSSKSDVAVWQAKVVQQVNDTEADVTERIANLRVNSGQNLAEIRELFIAEKDALSSESLEERTRIANELDQLSDRIVSLDRELRERSGAALERFTHDSEAFFGEFQKKVKELQTESDQKMKEFRAAAQETREMVDSMQKKLYGKIEENAHILSINLTEIDKKQKGFIEQTKIFERADSLRVTLQESVEELKSQIDAMEVRYKELKDVEAQFLKVRKLADEINAKTAKFAAEKRRIDLMEEDFKRLTNLSQTVDAQLGEVMGNSDALQAIQAKLRSLQELQNEVENRFDRLEQKRSILDVTIEGVDKNFRQLETLEKSIRVIQENVNLIPDRLGAIDEKVSTLSVHKDRADAVMKQIQGLDKMLKELEERTESVQKAREWLARTETRIEEVRRETEEQVRLLGSLLKQERKAGSKESKGAPPLGVRDTVVKLAHQGWSVEEIAKVTELSRGEVELILEISPK